MPNKLKLRGSVFGKLTVICESSHKSHNSIMWICKCECGREKAISGSYLVTGKPISCGCENAKLRITHGMSKSKIYLAWRSMKGRCINSKCKAFKNYGGRGISVCDRWLGSFENFLADMGGGFKDGLELDRVNNEGNYEKNNCRWITHKNQQRNRRTNHLFTSNGITMTLVEWEDVTGIKANTILTRIRRNWPDERILSKVIS